MTSSNVQYSEENLINLLKNKDRSGMSYLYDNYSNVLYGLIVKGVNNDDIAEDILQEVFIKIWKNISSYDASRGRLYTWMINIARNAVIDYLRSKQNQNQQKNQNIENSVNDINKNQNLEQKTDQIGLKQLVENLPANHKEIIELVYFKGFTQDETSKELNIPLGTVKTRVRTAINSLRSIFLEA